MVDKMTPAEYAYCVWRKAEQTRQALEEALRIARLGCQLASDAYTAAADEETEKKEGSSNA